MGQMQAERQVKEGRGWRAGSRKDIDNEGWRWTQFGPESNLACHVEGRVLVYQLVEELVEGDVELLRRQRRNQLSPL